VALETHRDADEWSADALSDFDFVDQGAYRPLQDAFTVRDVQLAFHEGKTAWLALPEQDRSHAAPFLTEVGWQRSEKMSAHVEERMCRF
jgi:hypothetical protein